MAEQREPDSTSASVKESVRSQFGPVAENYAASTVHSQGDEFQVMIELAQLSGDEKVLDAGCGPGHTALTFSPHAGHVTADDLTEAMLEQGRRLAQQRGFTNVVFELGDVENLPYDDNVFDVIVTRYSAHHWPSPRKALAEFRRTLRDDLETSGRLLIADVVSFDDFPTDTRLQAIEILRDASHVRDHTPTQWLEMLSAEGFDASIALRWSLHLEFESWVTRMQTPAANIAMIQTLLHNAPDSVRQNLHVEPDSSFRFPCALILAVPSR